MPVFVKFEPLYKLFLSETLHFYIGFIQLIKHNEHAPPRNQFLAKFVNYYLLNYCQKSILGSSRDTNINQLQVELQGKSVYLKSLIKNWCKKVDKL